MCVSAIALLFTLSACYAHLGCRDESNNPVDWWMVYKIPRIYTSNYNMDTGYAYMYLDSRNTQLEMSPNLINETRGAVYSTLQQVYDRKEEGNVGYAFYSDQWPNGDWSSSYGHTKGALGFDTSSGFWLVQSVPKFPNYVSEGYQYPSSGGMYGQNMFCVSVDVQEVNTVGSAFWYSHPWFYSNNVSSSVFGSLVPDLIESIDGKLVSSPPWSNTFHITSIGGLPLTIYAKNGTADFDMVSVQVAPGVSDSVYSETWQNGGKSNDLPPNCTAGSYDVNMISKLQFPQVYFDNSDDHAKWAVAYNNDNHHMCVGGMNRQYSQLTRSGLYVCWENESVASQFRAAVAEYYGC